MKKVFVRNAIVCISVLSVFGLIYSRKYVSKIFVEKRIKPGDGDRLEIQSGRPIFTHDLRKNQIITIQCIKRSSFFDQSTRKVHILKEFIRSCAIWNGVKYAYFVG